MKPGTINVHIDKIILDGVGQLNRGQFRLALEQELHRLISNQGLHGSLNQPAFINHIIARPISIAGRSREKQIGRQVANSIYKGMRR